MPNRKESESAKIQGDKLEGAVDRVAGSRSDRKRENEKSEKVEQERPGDAAIEDDAE